MSTLVVEVCEVKAVYPHSQADALEFIARNLSEVKLQESQKSLKELAWPILLLAANVSVDPASLDSYFHFAGLNALLYRNSAHENAATDLEVGMLAGIAMGIEQNFTLAPAHAHLNLVGGVLLFLFGLYYRLIPAAGKTVHDSDHERPARERPAADVDVRRTGRMAMHERPVMVHR